METNEVSSHYFGCPVSARVRQRYRKDQLVFLAERRKKRLNQASFVSLHFALFAFSGLCLVCTCIVCIFNFVMSSVLHFKEQPM